MSIPTEQDDDIMRCAIRVAINDVLRHPEAPEAIEFFDWHQRPLSSRAYIDISEDGPDEQQATSILEIKPMVRGLLNVRGAVMNDAQFYYWIGWHRYYQVAVVACGDRNLFPGDPRT